MTLHRTLHQDALHLRGDTRAKVLAQRKALEEIAAHTGCEVCGRTFQEIIRSADPDRMEHEVILRILPCEDSYSEMYRLLQLVDVHVVCSRCQHHPLVQPEDRLGTVRCVGSLTDADRAMIALSDEDAR